VVKTPFQHGYNGGLILKKTQNKTQVIPKDLNMADEEGVVKGGHHLRGGIETSSLPPFLLMISEEEQKTNISLLDHSVTTSF
jgi:hypothetical protein